MQIRSEAHIQRSTRPPAPPAPQAAARGQALDRVTITAPSRTADLTRGTADMASHLLAAAADLARRVVASLLPPGPLPVLMSLQADPLPRNMRKAFDNPETAEQHFAQLQAIDGYASAPEGLTNAYAAAVKATENAEGCRPILDLVKHETSPLEMLEAFRRLAESSKNADCAHMDLSVARTQATPQIPLAETSEHLSVLRALDVKKNDYYYGQSYSDLAPALAAVLDAPTADGRLANRKLVLEIADATGLGEAATQAAALKSVGEPLRSSYVKVLVKSGDGAASLRGVLAEVVKETQPAAEFARFRTLQDASGKIDVAADDLRYVRAEATRRGIPADEVADLAARMRATDPAKGDDYGRFRDQRAPLGHVLDAADSSARRAALDALQALEKAAGGNLQAADEHRQRLQALTCPPADRDAIASEWPRFLGAWSGSPVTVLAALDAIDDKREARERFAAAQTLFKAAGKADQGLSDLRLAISTATRRNAALATVTGTLARLREADPAREDDYGAYGDLGQTLDFALDGGGRLDTLLALRLDKAPDAALPIATRLYAMPAGRDDIEGELKQHLKKFKTHESVVTVLATAAASTEPATVVRGFRRLAEADNRVGQGETDLTACLEAAKKHGCPLEQVVGIAERLRRSDPAREDDYGQFAPLTPTLDVLLSGSPSVTELESAVDDLLKVQGKGRDAATALRHDEALRKVPCKPEERAELRSAYLDVLKKSSDDGPPIEALAVASSTPHPAETLRLFGRLIDASNKTDVALTDLKACVAASTRHKTLLSEAVSRLEPLRKNDPAREDYYATFGDATDTLDFVLTLPRQSRQAPIDGLSALLKSGRTLSQSLAHEKLLATLPGDVSALRAGHLKVAAKYGADSDDDLLKVLETAGRHTDAAATYDHFRSFLDLSRRPRTAQEDLTLLLNSTDLAETADLIARLRKADPALRDGYARTSPLDGALQAVQALPDAARRKAMAAELGRLWNAENNLENAVRDMGWISQGPMARNDVKDAVRKLTEIVSQEYDVADNARTLYEKVQRADIAEDRSWLARLFLKRGPYERGVQRLINGNRINAGSLSMVENLEKGQLPGEKFTHTVKRYEQIRKLESKDDDYWTPDPVRLTEVLPTSQMPIAWGTWTPQGKWEGFWALAQTQHSPLVAAAIWRCMASATDEAEAKTRQAAFDRIASLCGDDRDGAVQAYSAVAESLPAGTAVGAALPQMESLLQNQSPAVAARTYRIGHGLQSLPPAAQQAAQTVLGRARSGEEVDALYEAMKTPVDGEDMASRIDLLAQLIAGTGAPQALEGYAWLQRSLKPEEKALTAPLAGLVSVLLRNGAGLDAARDLLDWVRKRAADTTTEHLPPADMLVSLGTTLLMNPDIDNAKHQLAAAETRALKERLGQGGGIEVGDDTINVGGIRVPRNRS